MLLFPRLPCHHCWCLALPALSWRQGTWTIALKALVLADHTPGITLPATSWGFGRQVGLGSLPSNRMHNPFISQVGEMQIDLSSIQLLGLLLNPQSPSFSPTIQLCLGSLSQKFQDEVLVNLFLGKRNTALWSANMWSLF